MSAIQRRIAFLLTSHFILPYTHQLPLRFYDSHTWAINVLTCMICGISFHGQSRKYCGDFSTMGMSGWLTLLDETDQSLKLVSDLQFYFNRMLHSSSPALFSEKNNTGLTLTLQTKACFVWSHQWLNRSGYFEITRCEIKIWASSSTSYWAIFLLCCLS